MKISIIILTYNSSSHISELLAGITQIYKKEIDSKKLEVIVADNASSDDTIDKARRFKDIISVVQNGGNLGFAAGINKASVNATGEILLFINPDTKLQDGNLMDVVYEFEDGKVGVVGGEILSMEGKRELSCGKFYSFFNILLLSLGLEEIFGVRFKPNRKTIVDFVSGGFFAVKSELFKKLGGFDEHFFMYVEDVDLCYRVKKEGMQVKYSPFASVSHMGQGSSNRTFAIVNIYKGLLYFQKKQMSATSYILSRFVLRTKAVVLVIIGKIIHNQYVVKTYEEALKAT